MAFEKLMKKFNQTSKLLNFNQITLSLLFKIVHIQSKVQEHVGAIILDLAAANSSFRQACFALSLLIFMER